MNNGAPASGCNFGQQMVSQIPVFDNAMRKRKKRLYSSNQVIGKNLIRPDKRKKVKYL